MRRTGLLAIALWSTALAGHAAVPDRPADIRTKPVIVSVEQVEVTRLTQDEAYARQVLAALDAAERKGELGPEATELRMLALIGVKRFAEAFDIARAEVDRSPDDPRVYGTAFQLAVLAERRRDAVAILERASKQLLAGTRPQLVAGLSDNSVYTLSDALHATDRAERWRLAESLVTLGWPGPGRVEELDWQRKAALDGRIAKGDADGARQLAAAIATPRVLLRLLVTRTYDPLFGPSQRAALISDALERHDRDTAQRVRNRPGDFKSLLARIQHLRSIGMEQAALDAATPLISKWPAVVAGGPDAFWVVNEAAYSLLELGRGDEAVALMTRLIGIGLDEQPQLISMAINAAEVMNAAGRPREGAALAAQLARERASLASPYGRMWMWSKAACGYALAGEASAAKQWVDLLAAASSDNLQAHMHALLCTGDLDGAERVTLTRLGGDDAPEMMTALQDFQVPGRSLPNRAVLEQRLAQVLARPAVQAAIARAGRVMKLPLARAYWGEV